MKKFVSLLIICVMLISAMPIVGFSAEESVEESGSYSIDIRNKAIFGNINFILEDNKDFEEPKLLIAAYKNSLLVGVDVIDCDSTKTSYSFNIEGVETADKVRAYVWEYKKAAPIMKNPIDLKFDKIVSRKTFSILGDSYSTFAGYLHPENSVPYYPDDAAKRGNDVSKVEQTWWNLFAQEYNALLDTNNSYSGSTVCYDGYGGGTADAKKISFVKRITDVGNPDILIIEGGTNDDWTNAGYGEFKYDNFTEKDFETYRPALAYVLKTAKENNPDCRIIFMMNNGLDGTIASSTRTLCEYYDVELLALSGIDKQDGHPSIKGMVQIKNQLIALLNK